MHASYVFLDLVRKGKLISVTVITAPMGLGFLNIEVSRSHTDTSHSAGLIWTSDQPVADTCT